MLRALRGRSVSSKPRPRRSDPPLQIHTDRATTPRPPSALASVRQLLDSLNREQRRNHELLASLGFALRSFTNLSRFLELVPLVAARLVEGEGALLVVFHPDGRLWREQLHGSAPEVLRQLAALPDDQLLQASGDAAVAALLDRLVRRQLTDRPLFATSVVARSRCRGRLYVYGPRAGLSWSESHRRYAQLVADLAGVAIEGEQLLQEARRIAPVLLLGLTPVDEAVMPYAEMLWYQLDQVRRYETLLEEACLEADVPFLPLLDPLMADPEWLQWLCSDGIHLNSAGHRQVYERVRNWPALWRWADLQPLSLNSPSV